MRPKSHQVVGSARCRCFCQRGENRQHFLGWEEWGGAMDFISLGPLHISCLIHTSLAPLCTSSLHGPHSSCCATHFFFAFSGRGWGGVGWSRVITLTRLDRYPLHDQHMSCFAPRVFFAGSTRVLLRFTRLFCMIPAEKELDRQAGSKLR